MLKERRAAVDNVTAAFLSTEKSSEHAAAAGARCIAVFIEERARANLPINTGAAALGLIAEGVRLSLEARQRFIDAHAHLAQLPAAIGVHAYGTGDCPPNEPFVTAAAPLRVVVQA